MKGIASTFFENCKKYGDKQAIVCENEAYTYVELGQRVKKCAVFLSLSGVKKSDCICMLMNKIY